MKTILLQILIYLPLVHNDGCHQSAYAWEVMRLISADQAQARPVLRCNPELTTAATWRADSLANEDYFAHCDPAGLCANDYARLAGCKLGPQYSKGNEIESLVAGPDNPQEAYQLLMNSPPHREHLTGAGAFFGAQTDIGVATVYKPGTRYGWYTVVLIGNCL